jgi:TRAP-type C4-dicarboxylate transport system permease large subunit
VERIPNMMAKAIVNSGMSAVGFILLVVVMLLIFGMFMTSGITILAPLLVPIAAALKIDLIHFGLVMVFTLGIGSLWLNPYMNAAYAAFYRRVTREKWTTPAGYTYTQSGY